MLRIGGGPLMLASVNPRGEAPVLVNGPDPLLHCAPLNLILVSVRLPLSLQDQHGSRLQPSEEAWAELAHHTSVDKRTSKPRWSFLTHTPTRLDKSRTFVMRFRLAR